VTLVLQLPDGTYAHNFKLGATVAYVKLVIEQVSTAREINAGVYLLMI
jgi:hypothetical protein